MIEKVYRVSYRVVGEQRIDVMAKSKKEAIHKALHGNIREYIESDFNVIKEFPSTAEAEVINDKR